MGTLIQAEELATRLGDPRLRLVDCRFDLARPDYGREAWTAGHLPGAVHADLNRDLSAPVTPTSGRHPLPAPEDAAATMRTPGSSPPTAAVMPSTPGSGAIWPCRWLG